METSDWRRRRARLARVLRVRPGRQRNQELLLAVLGCPSARQQRRAGGKAQPLEPRALAGAAVQSAQYP